MAITATMVRELRDLTGAAMMDCKKALEAAGGDMQGAVDQLRKQGLKAAAKKAARETAEGRVLAVLAPDGRRGHLLGVACETDFLSSSDGFKDFVTELEEHVAQCDPDGLSHGERPLLEQRWKGEGEPVSQRLQAVVGQFGENVRVTELVRLETSAGRVSAYVHHDNKQGAIAAVTTDADSERAQEILKSLCQHVVVFSPAYARREEVPQEDVERERAVLRESDDVKAKPEDVRDKIVEGRLSKFYATSVLEEQPWIHDDKLTVRKALEKELGAGSRVEAFARIRLGG